jgi:hypothetical protein
VQLQTKHDNIKFLLMFSTLFGRTNLICLTTLTLTSNLLQDKHMYLILIKIVNCTSLFVNPFWESSFLFCSDFDIVNFVVSSLQINNVVSRIPNPNSLLFVCASRKLDIMHHINKSVQQ